MINLVHDSNSYNDGILKSLPPAINKDGWPWNEEVSPTIYLAEKEWPKISIVTPSYNQGIFIEQTIRSILLQNYPNLEYFIMDGGSTDETLDIIKKYDKKINLWASEPDFGQAHAINKGFKLCLGEIFNWINSDDLLAPNALFEIGRLFKESNCDLVAGSVLDDFDNSMDSKCISKNENIEINNILKIVPNNYKYHQPGIWFRKNHMNTLPKFSEDMHYYFDWDYTLKYISIYPNILYTDNLLVHFRLHEKSKSISQQDKFGYEIELCYKNLYSFLDNKDVLKAKAKRKFETIKWHSELQAIIKTDGYRLNTFKKIIIKIITAPKFRSTRFTFGQLKLFLRKHN